RRCACVGYAPAPGAAQRYSTARSSSTSATITATTTTTRTRSWKAPSSVVSGLRTWPSEDVDRRVDDDPHDVDEVPVDPGHLDAVVVLGREVPAERPDHDRQQQAQANEDVRAVQAGQPVEDRGLGRIRRREADVDVLVDLDE